MINIMLGIVQINRVYILLILFSYILYSQLSIFSYAQDDNEIVATIHDNQILYKDIKISVKTEDFIKLGFSENELNNQIRNQEFLNLLTKLEDIIVNEAISYYSINVSDEEIVKLTRKNIKEIFGADLDSEELIKKQKETWNAIEALLNAWHKNPQRAEKKYTEKYSIYLSEDLWENTKSYILLRNRCSRLKWI